MFCQYCGANLGENATICPICRMPVQQSGTTDGSQQAAAVSGQSSMDYSGTRLLDEPPQGGYQQPQGGYQQLQGGCQQQQLQGGYQQQQLQGGYQQPQQNGYQQQGLYQQSQGGYQQIPPEYRQTMMLGQQGTIGGQQFQVGYQQHPMKWYKFVIRFQLFFSAFIAVVYAVLYFTGYIYNINNFWGLDGLRDLMEGENYGEMAYDMYGIPIRILDIISGVVCLGVAVFAVVIRQKLAYFKQNAGGSYIKFWILLVIYGLFYSFVWIVLVCLSEDYTLFETIYYTISYVLGRKLLNPIKAIINVSDVVIIILNVSYFKKRKHLFVN